MKQYFILTVMFSILVASVVSVSGANGRENKSHQNTLNKHPLSEMLQQDSEGQKEKHVPGEILIKIKKGSSAGNILKSLGDTKSLNSKSDNSKGKFEKILERHQAESAKRVFSNIPEVSSSAHSKSFLKKLHSRAARKEDLAQWYKVTVPMGADLNTIIDELNSSNDVQIAEPVVEWSLADLPDATTDPQYGEQWHLIKADVPYAWQHLEDNGVPPGGMTDVVVAVIDTGVDYNHEDLIANMWVNGGEIPDNGVDDDNNGFIDDIHGCNVVSNEISHSGDPIDLNGHGTHVSGIIASTAFNGSGGVGVAYNVRIMAVRSAQYSGTLTSTDIAEGIMYAIDNGAEVINMSFGGTGRSQIVEDTLSIAFSQAVLVASAGNAHVPTEVSPNEPSKPYYPAALPWVLGVMASDINGRLTSFTNYDTCPQTNIEYEVAAPGAHIFSTLPDGQYAKWSGTSMAAPVISGIAALTRSFFNEREVYSNRFIMGQIAGSVDSVPRTPWPGDPGPVVDAYKAITEFPTPGVTMLENWIFDDISINEQNDGDGRVDAGETVHLAIELINRMGQAGNIVVTFDTKAGSAYADPYVALVTDSVNYADIGPFATGDNGFIYDDDGIIIGAEDPFVFTVDPNCPNDHVIPFKLTITYNNAWDPEDTNTYVREANFTYVVQRGRNLPTVISDDMDLTADHYWLVGGPVLIEEGVTVTVYPGTKIQWGGISDDPYNPGPQNGNILVRGKLLASGTFENPVEFYPSILVTGQTTTITVESQGQCDLQYTRIRNPNLSGVRTIDHCYFDWEYFSTAIGAQYISNSIFHKLPGAISAPRFDRCLFDASHNGPSGTPVLVNCCFLQDNENNDSISISVPLSFHNPLTIREEGMEYLNGQIELFYNPVVYNGNTYVVMPVEWTSIRVAETIANFYGGHVASIRDSSEDQFLKNYIQQGSFKDVLDRISDSDYGTPVYIGLTNIEDIQEYQWTDGSPLIYEDWESGYPIDLYPGRDHVIRFASVDWYWTFDFGWRNQIPEDSVRYGQRKWNTFLLRIPGEWALGGLKQPMESGAVFEYVRDTFSGPIKYNAFINKYWDPVLNNWLRVIAPSNLHNGYCALEDNYWGTTSTTLIDYAIYDYVDNFTSARVKYGTPPEDPYESTYPFVSKLFINGQNVDSIPEVGGGPSLFTVHFNRDMDTDIDPFVTFGPLSPYTDYVIPSKPTWIDPNDGGWIDSKTWQGSFWFTPVTGNGYHLMRISGAVAADDPWLVTGYDVGRFRFKVETMGVAAMTLQASGEEGSINLMWQQDDFDLLAGYNLYRADSPDGSYEKLNNTIIPVGQESYIDTDVLPAIPMYYKFTVVQTDFQESDFSNIASAAALDTIPPVLEHAPATTASPSLGLRLTALASDNVQVKNLIIHFRALGSSDDFQTLSMANISGNEWSGTIPGSWIQPPGIEYYIVASDGISEVYNGTPAVPHQVNVQNIPSLISVTPNHGPADGGTSVMLSGALFQEGASVFFGNVLATNVTVIGPSQITCTSPPHFPAMVDIRVVNPDTTECIRLNVFSYEDTGVVVSLPETSADYGIMIELDLSVSNVIGLRAADIDIAFDTSVLTASSVRTGTLTAGWAISENLSVPGDISLSLASSTAVDGNGSIVRITFNVTGIPPASTPLTISSAVLNDGAIDIIIDNGQFDVNGFFGITGKVNYFGGASVPGATLKTMGAGDFSTSSEIDGSYVLSNLPTGSYILKASKVNDVNEITAYDASLVLQSASGLMTLSQNQQIAADVNRNGSVTSMDASYILEKSVELIDVPFPGAGIIWDFVPSEINYPLLNSDKSNQNFTGVLIGDVSANWTYPGEEAMMKVLENMNLQATVSLPGAVYLPQESIVVPVNLTFEPEAEITSLDIEIHYDAQAIDANSIISGEMVSLNNMVIASNLDIPGVIKIGLAGDSPIIYEGDVAFVKFDVLSLDCNPQDLILVKASLNEGSVETQKINSSISLSPYRSDFNRNCQVEMNDLILFADQWLQDPINPLFDIVPMLYGDDQVDLLDFSQLSQEWIGIQ